MKKVSQRTDGFRGGIQRRQVATDSAARNLDRQLKDISKKLQSEFPDLTWKTKLPNNIIAECHVSCAPDGGAWFRGDVLVGVFEAKKQGLQGNAIERWFKNNYICRKMNSNVSYVTFCVGEGAGEGKVIQKTLDVAHEGFNKFNHGDNSCFLSPEGFTDKQIADIMRETLNAT